ncbi:MAG: aconitase/3-isopropylmalate dehydratase large subunit family protein [Pseudomonadota bacterium]|nr:aconitase/3-isopropylmalate dehydratase large subunit family protein [Pseudomonadota bacterium]
MSPQTLAEKLLSRAAGCPVRAGELIVCRPDLSLGTDGSIPMALDYLAQLHAGEAGAPHDASRLVFAFDHYNQSSGLQALALQERARRYALRHGIAIFEMNEGIGHQRVLETGRALPGQLVVGADSHTVTSGAMNTFATGIGSSDLAGIMYCDELWLKVPGSIEVRLTGRLRPGVAAKDVALKLIGMLRADGANYSALEFGGPGLAALDMDDRIVLANMSVEAGAKAGLFPCDAQTVDYLRARIGAERAGRLVGESADAGARYVERITIDLDEVEPMVALPHRVDRVMTLAAAPATPIGMVYLGTCTGGRVKDYREALAVLRSGGGVAAGVRLVVTPASEAVRAELEAAGMLREFVALGAEILPPGCGACCGTCTGTPIGDVRVVSTANRNFKGRMGNAEAQIYLASPAECARAAVTGTLGGSPKAAA